MTDTTQIRDQDDVLATNERLTAENQRLMVELTAATELLEAGQVQLIMVSVDPGRDTPEKLAEYVKHFYPTFIGGTNTPEEIASIASLYGIFYEVSGQTTSNGDYLIDHTATLMAIDRDGFLKVVFPFGITSDELTDDLKYMLR